ncbi:MFS transporter [Microbacterium sp. NPDC089696]|uniref:MFS transporter n=1 Tax=Microbacterium sp. NPDC089696 TaxID=3364199 RepID=UPI0037FE8AE8
MSSTTPTTETSRAELKKRRRTLFASSVGTFIEYFDYASYSYLALTLAQVFFADSDPGVAVVQTFGLFALSFVMRPLGALFWGHVGDRIGRKRTLAFTIIGMGIATTAIGLLPGYAVLGLIAPLLLLLLRMTQSFCASGEYAGAAVLVGESAPIRQRARWISAVPIGSATGFLLASFTSTGLHAALPEDAMLEWGWRVPFLLSAPLTLIAWYIRTRMEESPVFRAMEKAVEDKAVVAPVNPLRSLFRDHWRTVIRMLLIMAINACGYYLVLTYMATYLEQEVGLSGLDSNVIVTVALVVYLPLLYLFATMADRYGRKRILMISSILFVLVTLPAFLVLGSTGFVGALIVQLLLVAIFAMNDGVFATLFVESFPTSVRFSGFALPFNVGNALFGGLAPLTAAWLIEVTGAPTAPAFIVIALAVVAIIALLRTPETKPTADADRVDA